MSTAAGTTHRVADQLEPDVQALALAAGLGLIFLAVRMATAWTRRPWVGLGVGLWVAAHGTLAYYAGSGMETTLFALLLWGEGAAEMPSQQFDLDMDLDMEEEPEVS